ncbi:MAG TPA: tetratricopeptide repeat protein, partial [Planctomycetota bacterium]|nr:tetratricopeptide repeat protein [Planctomycetota bacterium]
PDAVRDFDAAMRAVKLGGPEAADKAIERLRSAVAVDARLWEAWYDLGVLYLARGDGGQATDALGRALAIKGSFRPALLARAEAHRQAGDVDAARADYQKALDLDPGDRTVGARLASLLRERKRYEDALDVIRQVLRNAGADGQLYVELGLIYLDQERQDLAELVLRKALEADAKLPAAHNAMALLALQRGQDQLAFERFDTATALDPAYVDARFNKAAVLLDAGDYARAKAELDEVVQQRPDDLDAQVALGVAQRGLKSFDQARATWEDVVRKAPRRGHTRGDALFNLAVLEMDHLNNDKAALAALDRYLQEAPRSHPKRKEAEERKKELGL